MKRIIITVSDDEHAQVKSFAAANKSDMQRVGMKALNDYFKNASIDIVLTDPQQKS